MIRLQPGANAIGWRGTAIPAMTNRLRHRRPRVRASSCSAIRRNASKVDPTVPAAPSGRKRSSNASFPRFDNSPRTFWKRSACEREIVIETKSFGGMPRPYEPQYVTSSTFFTLELGRRGGSLRGVMSWRVGFESCGTRGEAHSTVSFSREGVVVRHRPRAHGGGRSRRTDMELCMRPLPGGCSSRST